MTIISAALLYLCMSVTPLWAVTAENTYVFAVSACPPWKTKLLEKDAPDVANVCRNDVEVFTSSIKKALGIPSANIFTLIDEQATYAGLQDGLYEFAETVPTGSRVIMLLNFHGDLADINRKGKPEKDEVLVLWTEEKPFTMLSALALKQWITAKELRKMIDVVKADEIVIIVDACHAGAALPDILKKHGRDKSWKGREAVIMSSKSDQFSYFNKDGSHGLFTLYFSNSIASGSSTLEEAFKTAANETSSYIDSNVNQKECSEMLFKTLGIRDRCKQTPFTYDPSELLSAIKLNSAN